MLSDIMQIGVDHPWSTPLVHPKVVISLHLQSDTALAEVNQVSGPPWSTPHPL